MEASTSMSKRTKSRPKEKGGKTTTGITCPQGDTLSLVQRADDGDPEAQTEITRMLDEGRGSVDGSILNATAMALRTATAPESWTGREIARRELERRCADLAGPKASGLERALADRLALALGELDYVGAIAIGVKGVTLDQRASIEARYSAANRRAMSAAKTLAMVRRLAAAVPAVAVQVNMAGVTRVSGNRFEGESPAGRDETSGPVRTFPERSA
jgi:hypothetical protein